MSPDRAKPARYEVARRGTPDPEESRYYVLDVVHDPEARAMLRGLVRRYRLYGSSIAADELEAFLDDTQDAFADVIRRKNERLTNPKRRRAR